MSSKLKLKEAFEPESKFGAFFSSGHIEWHGNYLYCQTHTHINKVSVDSGRACRQIAKEDESIEPDIILTFTTNGQHTVTAHKSGLLKLWNDENELEKQWKYIHQGPIASLVLKDNVLLSGGSDGMVRLWDPKHNTCIACLKGAVGVINTLVYSDGVVYASGDDGNIISWYQNSVKNTYSGHFSKVTSIAFCNDDKHFISAGRDNILILWDVDNSHALQTIPVYQSIEAVIVLPCKAKLPTGSIVKNDEIVVACAGEKGCITIWDMKKSKCLYTQINSLISAATEEGSLAVTHLLMNEDDPDCLMLALVSSDHNIIIHNATSFAILKQLVGFSDEILDIALCGQRNEFIAVATNSCILKLYNTTTMNCQLLRGHSDIVMAVDAAPFRTDLLASCAKDNTLRLWLISDVCKCIAVGVRHSGTVSTAAFFNSTPLIVTGSQDKCIKLWDLAGLLSGKNKSRESEEKIEHLHANFTEIAHSMNINFVTVSPNDKLIATCSQDKTIQLWTGNLTKLAVLRGHRRGVWCCRFSPVDQVLVSSSADCTIKLWSLTEFNCLKSFEGHDASVLRINFLSQGMQLISCGADGLVKLFDIKSSECKLTLQEHEGRVWGLTVAADEASIFTGGSDSLLVRWKDVTDARILEKLKQQQQEVLEEQQLSNCLHQNDLHKALKLAIKLSKPFTALKIIQGIIKDGQVLLETISYLSNYEKEKLLEFACNWNTNSRSCHASQLVLNIILQEMQANKLNPQNIASIIEGNLGYTQRHYKRVTELTKDLHLLDYTVKCMQPFKITS